MSEKPELLIRMTTPVGEPLEIPLHDIGPRDAPPKIAIVSGIHGNELNGIFALARLADYLKSRTDPHQDGPALRERVLLIPAVNVLGLHVRTRTWPVDRTDINRMFPGLAFGETTQRIAAAVFERTKSAAIRIDIHASNAEFEELPHVRVYDSTEDDRRVGAALRLPAMVECPINTVSTATLMHAWKESGGQNFVIQVGAAGNLQIPHCDRLFAALVRLLTNLGVLSGAAPQNGDKDNSETVYFPLNRTVSIISEKAGLFVPEMTVGRWVEKGAVLGQVYDGFTGHIRASIKAPCGGFLTGLRYQALLYQGDLLARIQSSTDVTEGADTYLMGQGQ